MSSSKFEVRLSPDVAATVSVQGTALASWLAGIVMIATLDLPGWGRLLASIAWTALSAIEYRRWWYGVRELVQLRLSPGGAVQALYRNGLWHELRLLPGSTVTGQFVWLRFGGGARPIPGILFTRGRMPQERWRRLQVLLRCGREARGFWPKE